MEPTNDDGPSEISEGQRPCPVCGEHMQVESKRNVSVDVCPEHGIWLDSGELEKILLARSPRTQVRRQRSHGRARREGVSAGIRHGWLALFDS